jgi:hypothetical protein
MSLSAILAKYKGGEEVKFVVPLGDGENTTFVFRAFSDGASWQEFDRKLLDAMERFKEPDPSDAQAVSHRAAEIAAGVVYPSDVQNLTHAFLCFSCCTAIRQSGVKDGEKVETEEPLYKLSQWIQIANNTLVAKEAYNAINEAAPTVGRARLQEVYDLSKKALTSDLD